VLLFVPLLAFAVVFAVTFAYNRLANGENNAVTKSRPPVAAGNGRLIVALESQPGVRLYSVAPAGTGARMLTAGSEPADGSILVEAHPDWTPEAGRIVFTRFTVEGRDPIPPKIWAVDPDGTNLVQLTRGRFPISFRHGPRTERRSPLPASCAVPRRSSS
jgi:hypothetical protein